jgi:peptidylprolyl isomerase
MSCFGKEVFFMGSIKILKRGGARRLLGAALALMAAWAVQASGAEVAKPLTTADVLSQSRPDDWRPLDPDNTLYFNLAAGRVILELAPAFAPEHVANIKRLVRAGYFDGLAIIRAQDNYVVQWGDPDGTRENKDAQRMVPAEYFRALTPDLPFTRSPDGDVYAPEVGWSGGFPAALDPQKKRAWLTHCYGAVGVGRGNPPDTGSGTELYVVIGHAPRHLDRNLAVIGRAVQGMELLSALPRGTEALGFYAKPEQYVPIQSVRIAADVPVAQRIELQVLRTDTPTWAAYVESRRTRREDFFVEPTGHIELCNVAIPVRPRPPAATPAH